LKKEAPSVNFAYANTHRTDGCLQDILPEPGDTIYSLERFPEYGRYHYEEDCRHGRKWEGRARND